MKIFFQIIFAITLLACSSSFAGKLYHSIKKESLRKVNTGLSPLTPFTQKLTQKE